MSEWNRLDRALILASRSPRRKQILDEMGFTFSVKFPGVENEEEYIRDDDLKQSLKELAKAKANSIACAETTSIVLGCDTIVVLNGAVMGKPKDYYDACTMISALSGKTHRVYSAVALICSENGFCSSACGDTEVTFRELPRAEIDEYLSTAQYIDKAGAYAIQGKGMAFITRINGCFYNVMGLPVFETIALCKEYVSYSKGYSNGRES